MAKAAEKKAKRGSAATEIMPESWIEEHGGEGRVAASNELAQIAVRAWMMARAMDDLEEELKQLKAQLAQEIGAGRSLVVSTVCRVIVSATSSVSIADAEKLRELLGDRWSDLVTESISYKPSEKLIALASDADDPMSPAYRALLRVRIGTSVRILAEK